MDAHEDPPTAHRIGRDRVLVRGDRLIIESPVDMEHWEVRTYRHTMIGFRDRGWRIVRTGRGSKKVFGTSWSRGHRDRANSPDRRMTIGRRSWSSATARSQIVDGATRWAYSSCWCCRSSGCSDLRPSGALRSGMRSAPSRRRGRHHARSGHTAVGRLDRDRAGVSRAVAPGPLRPGGGGPATRPAVPYDRLICEEQYPLGFYQWVWRHKT